MRRFNVFTDPLEAKDESSRPGYSRHGKQVDDAIGADLIGGSVYELDENERICPYHYHHGVEEWALVLDGEPTVRRPSGETKLRRGDVVCFPAGPDGAHTMHGPGKILMLSAERWPAVVVYPDSDKVGARPGPLGTQDEDRLNFPRAAAVDYWHGER